MQEQPIDQEAAARGKRRLITIFCVMITILLLGILLYYVNCIRPVDNFRTLYTDGQYEAALTLYENTLSKVDGNARKAEQCVRDHLEHAWAQYRDAVIDRSQMETACAVAEKYPALEEDLAALKPDLTLLYASRAAYEEGCSLLDAGQYLDAIAQFSSMSENDTLYIEGTSRIREAQESYCQQIVAQTGALMSQARYEDAMTAVEDALTRFPEATTLTAQKEVIYNAYKDYRKQTSMAEAQAALDQGNLEEALRILAPLKKDYPDDADLSALTDQYEASYCAQIAEAATPLLEERQYRQAFDIVSPAYDIFPENDTIASLYDQAEGHLPQSRGCPFLGKRYTPRHKDHRGQCGRHPRQPVRTCHHLHRTQRHFHADHDLFRRKRPVPAERTLHTAAGHPGRQSRFPGHPERPHRHLPHLRRRYTAVRGR